MFFLRDGLLAWGPEWPRCSKTKKTLCVSLLFMQKSGKLYGFAYFLVPPSTTSPGSPGSSSTAAAISKSNENTMRFHTFCRKAMKTQGFSMVWERGLRVQSHESTKSSWKPKVFQCFFCATDFCHGAQNGPGAQKPRKLNAFHYFLCKNQENSMVLLTF